MTTRKRQFLLLGASLGLLLGATACGSSMKNARKMNAQEERTFVSRPPPQKIPSLDSVSSVGGRIHIQAPPARVWQVMALGFGDLENFAGAGVAASECITEGEGELGAVRSCKIANHMPMIGGELYEEKIIGWDPGRGYFSVLQTRSTGPTDILINENWISSDGKGGSVVTSIAHVDFDLMPSLMGGAAQFKRKLVEIQIGLKHFVETGERVTAENWKRVVKLYPRVTKENEV